MIFMMSWVTESCRLTSSPQASYLEEGGIVEGPSRFGLRCSRATTVGDVEPFPRFPNQTKEKKRGEAGGKGRSRGCMQPRVPTTREKERKGQPCIAGNEKGGARVTRPARDHPCGGSLDQAFCAQEWVTGAGARPLAEAPPCRVTGLAKINPGCWLKRASWRGPELHGLLYSRGCEISSSG